MTRSRDGSWLEANQRCLAAEVGRVRRILERHARRLAGVGDVSAEPPEEPVAVPRGSALEAICGAFQLSDFERDVLLLCAGVELDARVGACCAALHGHPERAYPTFSLALAALPDPHWSAVSPAGPLRRWSLVEPTLGESVATSPLRIDERVLHFLTGTDYFDERLHVLTPVHPTEGTLPASYQDLVQRVVEVGSGTGEGPLPPVIQLWGGDVAAQRAVAAAACTELGRPLFGLFASDISALSQERESLARVWEREAVLSGSVLLVEWDDACGAEAARNLSSFLNRTGGLRVVVAREPLVLPHLSLVRFEVGRPTAGERRVLWEEALGPLGARLNGQVDAVVSQFDLGMDGIRAASARVRASQAGSDLWESCRTEARIRVDDLAQRIDATARWDDLVLPDAQRQALREILMHVRHRTQVFEHWGFGSRTSSGTGVSVLFAGPSGTGKTMAAEVLAGELRLDLFRVDLSTVVSKYIGETEKNLRRVFDAAEEGGAILLFDEADALFGKRSEVRDSHDRYANLEVSYLLQRMETYRGLAILTTNFQEALDSAFVRRLRFIVQFPFPDTELRAEIWRRVFPAATPTEGVDVHALARLNLTGGGIRNVALGAAFLAAENEEPVRMTHLFRAARSEYAKLEKPLHALDATGAS